MNILSKFNRICFNYSCRLSSNEHAAAFVDEVRQMIQEHEQPSPAPAAGITFFYDGGDPFICEVHESCTLDDLEGIQKDVLDLVDEYMDKGHGLYAFSSKWIPEESDLGYITSPGYWEMQLLNWQPLPAQPADEACECDGQGWIEVADAQVIDCPACCGDGKQQHFGYGAFDCPDCHGTGKAAEVTG